MQNSQQYILWSTNMNTRVLPEYFISIKFPERNTCKFTGKAKHKRPKRQDAASTLFSLVPHRLRPLRVVCDFPARSLILSGGAAGRRGEGCVARVVQSRLRFRFRLCLLFTLVETGVMPSWSLFLALASGAEARKSSSSRRCSWWMVAETVSGRSSSLNKLVFWCRADPCQSLTLDFFSCHQGDGTEDWSGAAWWWSVRWGNLAAAIFGAHPRRPFIGISPICCRLLWPKGGRSEL